MDTLNGTIHTLIKAGAASEANESGAQARFDRAVDDCWLKGQEFFDFSTAENRRTFEDALIDVISFTAPTVAANWRSNQGREDACSYPWNN